MRNFYFSVLLFAAIGIKCVSASAPHREFPSQVHFVENKNQWENFVRYEAEFRGGKLFLEANRFTYVFYNPDDIQSLHPHEGKQIDKVHLHSIRITPVNANLSPVISRDGRESYNNNYFIGSDSSKWASNVGLFSSVMYNDLYPNVDMKFYSNLTDIKYDFILKPGANANNIQLNYEGVDKLFIKDESLYMQLSVGDIVEEKPYAYQLIDGLKQEIECKFKLKENILSFRFPHGYDKTLPVIIDPTLIFSSYTGSTADNWGFTATYDAAGDLYSGGNVNATGYPVTIGAYQQTYGGGGPSGNGWACDIAIAKFNPTGTTLLYATYLGGSDNDQPQSLIVDGNDDLVIFGTTYSANFPVKASCYDTSINGSSDIIITKLSPNGDFLLASTFIGGAAQDGINTSAGFTVRGPLKYNYSDEARGEIIIDNNNNYIIGTTTMSLNFPTTPGTIQPVYRGGLQDGVVFKMNSSLTGLLWSTFLGGSKEDAVYDCLLDPYGDLFISGGTNSLNFPTTTGAINTTFQGGPADGFLVHLNANGSGILASTYIGTPSYDQTFFVEMDLDGDVYCMGQTEGNYPVTAGVYSNFNGKQFIHKLSPDLTYTIYSTVFGNGSVYPNISPTAFLVDTCENVYVAGWGRCLSFGSFTNGNVNGMPVTPNAFQATTNGCDFYFFVLSRDAYSLSYATYFGGTQSAEHVDGGTSRFDKDGVIYEAVCAGCGGRSDFPTTPGVVSRTNNSFNCNNGVIKLSMNLYQAQSQITTAASTGCLPYTITFTNNSLYSVNFLWDFRDGTPTSTLQSPTHTFTTPGVYNVMLVVTNNNSCFRNDTSYVTITVVAPLNLPATFTPYQNNPCADFFVNTQTSITSGLLYHWDFGDGFTSTASNPSHLYADSGTYQISLIVTDSMCTSNIDTITNSVRFLAPPVYTDIAAISPANGCAPLSVSFSNNSATTGFHFWNFMDGSPIDTTFNAIHSFANAGTFHVMFVVSDSLSCNHADSAFVNVNVLAVTPVTASFNSLINQSCSNQSADFNYNGSGGNTFNWDFGDGTSATGPNATHIYSTPGNYQVLLTASDNVCGSTDTISQTLTFYPPITSSVAAVGATSGCPPLNVSFSNNSSTTGNHFWNFMDGSAIDTSFNPNHSFANSGTYQVMFVVSDTLSCNRSDTDYVNVNVISSPPVIANFATVVHSTCTNPSADFSFTGSGGNSYYWDLGDGNFASGVNVSHAYSSTGNYNVTLIATDTVCGGSSSVSEQISFYAPASAAIAIVGSGSGCPPLNVHFSNNSSTNGSHFWNFMDGSPVDTSFNPNHTFANLGSYQVMFVVTDPLSCNGADTDYVNVDVLPSVQVVASFATVQHSLCISSSADFSFNGTGGTFFNWDFGDGTLGSGANVSHTFSNFGNYQVTLNVNDPVCGSSGTTSQMVSFYPPVSASVAAVGATSGCTPLSVSFTNNSSTNGTHFWNFMDGSATDTSFNTNHNFTVPGNYHVMFVVSDIQSCNGSDTDFVNVNILPTIPVNVSFNTILNPACINPSAYFNFTGSGGNSYNWDFGDGTFGSGINVTHIYSGAGNYQVTLTVNDTVCGLSGSNIQPVQFYPAVSAAIAVNGPVSGCAPLNVAFTNSSSTNGNHFWNFMDGSVVDTSFNTNHNFTIPGNYDVMFVVSDNLSCNGSDTDIVNINVLPSIPVIATFNEVLNQACTNPSADFNFTGSGGNLYNWDFGDGTFGSGTSVTHIYSGAGNYQVTLTVNDTVCGLSGNTSQPVTFYPAASASIGVIGATTSCPPLNVSFSNNSSTGGNHYWNFMDGSPVDTSFIPTHTFANLGIYQVMFVVSDLLSCNGADTAYININVLSSVQVVASFASIIHSLCSNPSADFSFNGTGGTTFDWDFGDGTIASGANVSHTYSSFGNYQVTLNVNDAVCGSSGSITHMVTFYPPVSASVAAIGATTGCPPLNVAFANNSSGGNYSWNFMDGSAIDTSFNTNHAFTTPGNYNVEFIVTNPNSCNLSDTDFVQVSVIASLPVIASFNLQTTNNCDSLDAFVTYNGTGGNNYSWNFGDGAIGSGISMTHHYSQLGSFLITLLVNDTICNGNDTSSQTVVVKPSIKAKINSDKTFGCAPQSISLTSQFVAANYLWDFDDNTFSSQRSVVHDYNLPGQYYIRLFVSDTASCNFQDSSLYKFDVYETPIADFTYSKNSQPSFSEVEFTDQSSTNSVFYLWNFGDHITDTTNGSVNHNYYNKGVYNVCLDVTTINGCVDSTCRDITIENGESIFVPSSFSPNGDGVNDLFKVYFTGLTELDVVIYDRWGVKIFEFNTLDGGWNGTYKGKPAEEDVYVYKIIARGLLSDRIEKTGSVTLIY